MSMRDLLNIPEGYKITKIDGDKNKDEFNIHIEPYKRKKGICSGCGKTHEETKHGIKIVKARDLPVCGKAVYLHVTKKRYRCPIDGRIYIEEIEWLKKKDDIPEGMLKKYIASHQLPQIKKQDGF